MTRTRNWPPEVLTAIELKAKNTNATATEIAAEIQRDFEGLPAEKIPSVRTVQEIVKEFRPPDPSGPWRFSDANPAAARFVLPVLAAVIERTEGKRTLTKAEAKWVVRLARAGADDLHPWGLYQLARLYREREAKGADTADLDAFVGFAPWRAPPREARLPMLNNPSNPFERALEEGWVETPDPAKIFLMLQLQGICHAYITPQGPWLATLPGAPGKETDDDTATQD